MLRSVASKQDLSLAPPVRTSVVVVARRWISLQLQTSIVPSVDQLLADEQLLSTATSYAGQVPGG